MKYSASVRFAPLSMVANTPGWPSVGTIVGLIEARLACEIRHVLGALLHVAVLRGDGGQCDPVLYALDGGLATGFRGFADRRIAIGRCPCRRTEHHRARARQRRRSQKLTAIQAVRFVREISHRSSSSVPGWVIAPQLGILHDLRTVSQRGSLQNRLMRWIAVLLLTIAVPGCVSTGKVDTSGMSFSEEPLLGKVVWNDLITEDLDAARRFYGELFGWTFEDITRADIQGYALAKSGGVYVAGFVPVARRSDGVKLSRWLPYISVEDVDAAVSKASASQGKVAVDARNVDQRAGSGDHRSRRRGHRPCEEQHRRSG